MQPLPRDFLENIALEYNLTTRQTEVFVVLFSRDLSHQEVAQQLNISRSVFNSILNSIYEAFSLKGNRRNKAKELPVLLLEMYQSQNNIPQHFLQRIKEAKEKQLEQLDLSKNYNNKSTTIPLELFELKHLKVLNLSYNKITFIPKNIGNLSSLTNLDLRSNQLTKLPESIGNFSHLTWLDLVDNQLIKLPKYICNLSNLTGLDCRSNKLTQLPKYICNLSNLTGLYLNNNQIKNLPESICNLSNLTGLDLRGNPLESPPIEIAEKGIKAIRGYFRQLKQGGKDYIYEAKLLIVGEAGAGKTTLANKILNRDYLLEENQKSTEGIDVIKWKFYLDNGQEFMVNIWDFGGQEIYHSTHQFFLTKRSLYILLADTRKEDTDFYYWLNVVELLSENSPLLIIKNEKQNRKREINETALRGRFNNLKETLTTNLADNRGLENILKHIKHYISGLPHIGQGLPKTWVKVRQALEEDKRNYISLEEYLAICEDNNFTLTYSNVFGKVALF